MSTAEFDPPDLETYNKLYQERNVISGFGLDTTMSLPCPFCCEAGFLELKPADPKMDDAMTRETICKKCLRGAKTELKRDQSGVRFEVVQTCGVDPASYLPPMRRV